MKTLLIAGILSAGCLSCQRKEEPREESGPAAASASRQAGETPPGQEDEDASAAELPTKTKAMSAALEEKRPPIAEPVADRPGMVKSPFNGKIVDVRGIPGGTLVADPTYPSDKKKYFRVPEMPEDDVVLTDPAGEQNPDAANAPVGRAVPGKDGFIFSPYTNQIIDVTGFGPDDVVRDPSSME